MPQYWQGVSKEILHLTFCLIIPQIMNVYHHGLHQIKAENGGDIVYNICVNK